MHAQYKLIILHAYVYVYCTDDPDDGMGLPTICRCKPRPTPPSPTPTILPTLQPTSPSLSLPPTPTATPTLTPSPTPPPGFTVMFNDSSYCGNEADGLIAVTLVATGVSSLPYNVMITLSEIVPVSAKKVFDFLNDTIVVSFNPGETTKTRIYINPEGSEFLNLTLSLDPAALALGITLGDPSVVVVEIKDTDGK